MTVSHRAIMPFFIFLVIFTFILSLHDAVVLKYIFLFALIGIFLYTSLKAHKEYTNGNMIMSCVYMIASAILLNHAIFTLFYQFTSYTSYLCFFAVEIFYFIILAPLWTPSFKMVRISISLLAIKAIFFGLLPIGTLLPKGEERFILYHDYGIYPPLIGLPVLLIVFVELMAVGVYMYKMIADPAGWRRPIY